MARDAAIEGEPSLTHTPDAPAPGSGEAGPAKSDVGAGAAADLAAPETPGLDGPDTSDTSIGSIVDSPAEAPGQEASISPVDGSSDGIGRVAVDGGEIDGAGNPIAGLRIAFVGTENPTSELALTTWLGQSTGVAPARILTSATTLTAETLASYDVLILERLVRSYSQTEAALLASWVTGGGAVLSISGFYSSGSDTTYTNSLLSGIGIAYGSYVLGSAGGPFYVSQLTSHPVTAGITSLPFWGGFTVQPAGIADGLGMNTTLATSSDQPLGMVQVRGQGRVLVWGDEWIENDAVSATADIRRFWLQALTWLARR